MTSLKSAANEAGTFNRADEQHIERLAATCMLFYARRPNERAGCRENVRTLYSLCWVALVGFQLNLGSALIHFRGTGCSTVLPSPTAAQIAGPRLCADYCHAEGSSET